MIYLHTYIFILICILLWVTLCRLAAPQTPPSVTDGASSSGDAKPESGVHRLYIYMYTVYDIHKYILYIQTYIHTCIHAYMHTCIHAYMHTHTHIYIYIYIYI